MFHSNSHYMTQDGSDVRILVTNDHLEGFIYCDHCGYESKHEFTLKGDSACKGCKHGNLISLIDTTDETYSIKGTKRNA